MSGNKSQMSTGRALLTEREIDYLRGEEGDQRKYEAVSRVRRRIQTELSEDINVLEETRPELLEELRSVVCESNTQESDGEYDERALEDAREILIENNRRNQSTDDLRLDDSAVETQAEKVGVSPEKLIDLLKRQ